MGPRVLTKENGQLDRQNDFSFTEIKLVYFLTRKTLWSEQSGSERDITLQKQLGIGSPGIQALYF